MGSGSRGNPLRCIRGMFRFSQGSGVIGVRLPLGPPFFNARSGHRYENG